MGNLNLENPVQLEQEADQTDFEQSVVEAQLENSSTNQQTEEVPNSEVNNTSQARLNDKHYAECMTKRGLPPEWIAVNCRSMTIKEASDRLGYATKSGGIWLEGFNGFGQFRPNKPWKNEGDKKAPKYRTATGEEYDAMLPHHPTNRQYWTDLVALKAIAWIIDGHPCLGITEGLFKAITACCNDIPCIALAGVEQGLTPAKADPQGRRYLVDTLEMLARTGFGFIIIYDADATTNDNVNQAQRKLGTQLLKFKVPVYIATGLWSVDQGKGMDDFIKNNGAEQFKREVMGKIVDFSSWEHQLRSDSEAEIQNLTSKTASQKLAEKYRTEWKYDLKQQTWRHYNGKIWEQTPDQVFAKSIYHDLEVMPGVNYDTYSFVENVIKFLALELQERDWTSYNRAEWIAFSDRVLEVVTGKTHKHAPGFMFTSCLEHQCPDLKWGEGGDLLELLRMHAPAFYSWAMYSQQGDPLKVLKLLAILNGVLTYRFFDLQMFVMLLGVPGSGKGTFARLLETAVGKANHASAKMHRLTEDNVIASIIDKQLVICPDEKKQLGDNSGVLVMTGGDSIGYRQIYKPMSNAKFYGALIVLGNSNPFVGDTAGIDRRLSLVQFDKPLLARDTGVERQIQSELGVLISLALAMPQSQVEGLIKGTGDEAIPDFKRQIWLHKTENDSIALFMEEMLVPANKDTYTILGGKGDDSSSLYGAYVKMCDENNTRNPFTKNNFRSHLLELCREAGWDTVRESRCGSGWRVYGVSIRGVNDDIPRISDYLAGVQGECTECRPSVDPNTDLKPLPDKESVGSVALNYPNNNIKDEHQPIVDDENPKSVNNRDQVYTPTLSSQDKSFEPTQVYTQSTLGSVQPTLSQQIVANWDNKQELGKIILAAAESVELKAITSGFNAEQLRHIKDAANQAWKPNCNSCGEYCGEKVELWEFGDKRDWKVRTASGSIIPAARGNVYPWLGI
jgi:putative DNA primase/helicase